MAQREFSWDRLLDFHAGSAKQRPIPLKKALSGVWSAAPAGAQAASGPQTQLFFFFKGITVP